LIEKVKLNYDKKLQQKICELEKSRKVRSKSNSKKRSKTTDRKYHTGVGSVSKQMSKQLFSTPVGRKGSGKETGSSRKASKSKKKLKRA
jgi:hypothetical protein